LSKGKLVYPGGDPDELPRSNLRGISLAEFIDLIEASFEEFTRRD